MRISRPYRDGKGGESWCPFSDSWVDVIILPPPDMFGPRFDVEEALTVSVGEAKEYIGSPRAAPRMVGEHTRSLSGTLRRKSHGTAELAKVTLTPRFPFPGNASNTTVLQPDHAPR